MGGHIGPINSYNLVHELANLPPNLASPALPDGPKTPAPCLLYELHDDAPRAPPPWRLYELHDAIQPLSRPGPWAGMASRNS